MDTWESVLDEIELSKQQIVSSIEASRAFHPCDQQGADSPIATENGAVNGGEPPSCSLSSLRKVLKVKCGVDRTIPFVVEGGSENGQLIFVGAILHDELVGQLGVGDVVLTVNDINLSGRVLSEVSTFLYTVFYSSMEIVLEFIPAGHISTDIREVLADKERWQELHPILRDNIYLRTVPCTTRPPTEDETDGEHYHFISVDRFVELLEQDVFLEHGVFQDPSSSKRGGGIK